MKSLKTKRVADGKGPVQDRAITPRIMELLYEHSMEKEGGKLIPERVQMYCMYLLAFRCYEVLSLTTENIEYRSAPAGRTLKLFLKFRKTDQQNELKTEFVLVQEPESPDWMCPIRAFLMWINLRGPQSGPLFYKFSGNKIVPNVSLVLAYDTSS